MTSFIYQVNTNLLRACTIFPKSLKIFTDYVVFRKRAWFNVEEVTVTTSNIVQVHLRKGILFSTLVVMNSSGSDVAEIKHIWNPKAIKAKQILDQKLYQIHTTGFVKKEFENAPHAQLDNFEKTLGRLKELLQRGKITQKEFDEKRQGMLKKVK